MKQFLKCALLSCLVSMFLFDTAMGQLLRRNAPRAQPQQWTPPPGAMPLPAGRDMHIPNVQERARPMGRDQQIHSRDTGRDGRVPSVPFERPPLDMGRNQHLGRTDHIPGGTSTRPPIPEPANFVFSTEPSMNFVFPGDFQDLHEAVANIPEGGTLTIARGIHRINRGLVIDRSIRLVGATGNPADVTIESIGNSTINVNYYCFYVTAENAKIQGLTLIGKSLLGTIQVTQGQSEFRNCWITSSGNRGNRGLGISIAGGSANPTFSFCKIFDCRDGIIISQNGRGTFDNCEIYGNDQVGIVVREGCDPRVIRSKIYNNRGVSPMSVGGGIYASGGTFDNCEVYNNGSNGIVVSHSPTIRNSIIRNNGEWGIYIRYGGRGRFENNTLSGNTRGAWDFEWVRHNDAVVWS